MEYKKQRIEGYDKFTAKSILTLIGGFLMMLVVGFQFAWGNISIYCTGYLRLQGNDVTTTQLYIVLSYIILCSSAVFPIGMSCSKRYGVKLSFLIGGTFCTIAILLASIITDVLTFKIVYVFFFSIGKGFLYPCSLNAIWTHMPGRKGLVSGLIVAGNGLGAAMFNPISTWLVNPNNLESVQVEVSDGVYDTLFPDEVNEKVPYMFRMVAIIFVSFTIISVCISTHYSGEVIDVNSIERNYLQETEQDKMQKHAESVTPIIQLLKSKQFWHVYIFSILMYFFGGYIMVVYKTYGLMYGINDDHFLSLLGSSSFIINAISRIFWGNMLDKFNNRQIIITLIFIELTSCILFRLSVSYKITYFIDCCLALSVEGAQAAIIPPIVLAIFGLRNGNLVYSFMFSNFGISSLGSSLIIKLFYASIGYNGVLIIGLFTTIGAFILALLLKKDLRYNYIEALGGEERVKNLMEAENKA